MWGQRPESLRLKSQGHWHGVEGLGVAGQRWVEAQYLGAMRCGCVRPGGAPSRDKKMISRPIIMPVMIIIMMITLKYYGRAGGRAGLQVTVTVTVTQCQPEPSGRRASRHRFLENLNSSLKLE